MASSTDMPWGERADMEPTILEALAEAIVIVDDNQRIETLNSAAVRMCGYDSGEVIGHPVGMLLRQPLREQEQTQFRILFQDDQDDGVSVRQGELVGVRKNGVTVPMQWVVSRTRVRRRRSFVCVIKDISERKKIEARLQASEAFKQELGLAKERAEAAARTKSEFLATMSHEIRTPLNAILGTLNLLLDTPLTKKQRSFAKTAEESGKALLTIINDILDLSKIEAGRLELEPVDFDVIQMVENIVELLAPRAHGKHIEIASLLNPDVPRCIHGDAGRLRQILLNLAGNAIKFTHAGGVVIRLSMEGRGGDRLWLCFEVSDTGIGIPKAVQATLFERFSYSHSRRYEGTGLGLAISRRLAEMMGGKIGFSSREGQGSTFWFTVECGLAKQIPPAPNVPSLLGYHVLIAENNPVSRYVHETQLKAWGMRVTSVSSGSVALKALCEAAEQGTPFAAALIDQRLPDVSGEDLGLTLSRLPALAGTHPLLMTIMDASSISARVRKLGFYACLTKPLRQASLYRWLCVAVGLLSEDGAEIKRAEDKLSQRPVARKGRLLLVEDNRINQAVAVAMLEKAGYQVDAVGNGLEAIQALSKLPYDLVLMDLSMPEMDGFEATVEIRRLPGPQGRVPIIAMTANVLPEDRARCLAIGMNDFITKPVDRPKLLEIIGRWLSEVSREADGSAIQKALDA